MLEWSKCAGAAPWRCLRSGLLLMVIAATLSCRGCGMEQVTGKISEEAALPLLNQTAEAYVKLVLAVGQHDKDYVDAFYGPAAWRQQAEKERRPLAELRSQAAALIQGIAPQIDQPKDAMNELRRRFLHRQLTALVARVDLLEGQRLSFDEEAKALYDATPPVWGPEHFQPILDQIDQRLRQQGLTQGTLVERYEAFRQQFMIPPDRLREVMDTAIAACREVTEAYLNLPEDESFEVEYVSNKPWSAYNWYQGGYHSLIQVNTDLPIAIDRALDLACHEGYPGHHVYNALLEQHLVLGRGWVEFSVYPLFSPQSLLAEGSANYGIEMAFPGEQQRLLLEQTLFPLAGLDPSRAGLYFELQQLVKQLSYADNEAARGYLDGKMDARGATAWLTQYAMMSPRRAEQRLAFIERYRSYVINYNLGEDLVRQYLAKQKPPEAEDSWAEFASLLSSPHLPSDLL